MTRHISVLTAAAVLAGAASCAPPTPEPRSEYDGFQLSTSSTGGFIDREPAVPDTVDVIANLAKDAALGYAKSKGLDLVLQAGVAFGLLSAQRSPMQLLDQLHADLNAWAVELEWRIINSDRVRRVSTVFGAAQTAAQLGWVGDGTLTASGAAVNELEHHTNFERKYVAAAVAGPWQQYTTARATVDAAGRVYDWRLGVPALMEAVALRLPVLGVGVPAFAANDGVRAELTRLRDTLRSHRDAMLRGISCGEKLTRESRDGTSYPGCADIHSGLSALSAEGHPRAPHILTCEATPNPNNIWYDVVKLGREGCRREVMRLQAEFDTWLANKHTILRRQVMDQLPMFALQSLIDGLTLIVMRTSDLTENSGAIALADAPHLCLDVQNGNPAAGTPVWLWQCDGGDAQRWQYDRKSGLIRNPVFDKCLDVEWGSMRNGAPIWTWDCIGTPAQRWTYDPERKVLQNALGSVVDVEWGVLEAARPIWTWDRNEGHAQRVQ